MANFGSAKRGRLTPRMYFGPKPVVAGAGPIVFTTVFSTLADFTRATVGTYVNSSGVVLTAPVNTQRASATQNPVYEASAINYTLQSENYSVSPWLSQSTRTYGQPAPDGSNNAVRLDCGSGEYSLYQQAAHPRTVNGVDTPINFTLSGWMKTTNPCQIGFGFNGTTTASNNNGATFDVTTAWQRFSYTRLLQPEDKSFVCVGTQQSLTTAKVALPACQIIFWGMQLEMGTNTTSYFPTTTVAGTRAADNGFIPTTAPDGDYAMKYTMESGATFDLTATVTSGKTPYKVRIGKLAKVEFTPA